MPLAISSAFTNSLQSNISGKIVNEAVVLPAPLGSPIKRLSKNLVLPFTSSLYNELEEGVIPIPMFPVKFVLAVPFAEVPFSSVTWE